MAVKGQDQVTIVDVTDAYTVNLSNDSTTFPGSETASLEGSATTTITALLGETQIPANVVLAEITKPSGITITKDSNTTSPTLTIAIAAGVTSAGTITIPVHVGDDVTFEKVFSFALALKGGAGSPGADGRGISSIDTTYRIGANATTPPTGSWSSTPMAATDALPYLWTKNVATYTTGSPDTDTFYSVSPKGTVGSKGDPGEDGSDGLGIKSVVPQCYLSTSNSSQTGGSWSATPAAWVSGRYYWTRSQITWDDDTVTYSDAVLDQATNTANQNASNAYTNAQAAYRIVSNTGSIERTPAGAINPGTLNMAAYHPINGTQTAYSGRWKIEVSADQSTWTELYTSSADEASKAQALTGNLDGMKFVRASLYAAGGTTTLLQQATIGVVEATGNFLVRNSNGLYVCDTEGDPDTGGALRLASDVVEMLKNGNVLMRLAATAIELGVDTATSVIRLCGGTGTIAYYAETNQLAIMSPGSIALTACQTLPDGTVQPFDAGIACNKYGVVAKGVVELSGSLRVNGREGKIGNWIVSTLKSGGWTRENYASGKVVLEFRGGEMSGVLNNTGGFYVSNVITLTIPSDLRMSTLANAIVSAENDSYGIIGMTATTSAVNYRVLSWYQTGDASANVSVRLVGAS